MSFFILRSSNNLSDIQVYRQYSLIGFNYLLTPRAIILYTSILEIDGEFLAFLVARHDA